ncbi:hypothetical protein KsCSTR_10560 [Candidatus Kuenenia stuttgartiensis]|uniref:Uncharacterized protein n=1 Tax=Kuenenia stuttgartiensis TaxID=174633 RepID=Q1PYP4_KUEST|nr:hypothetical protein KsCSTR_10560 [Candidatus Kuenenia stuttgartiensis]CAJ72205.1 unknown protein [Candidatus Kuenenia stuttgartiensis]
MFATTPRGGARRLLMLHPGRALCFRRQMLRPCRETAIHLRKNVSPRFSRE